MKAISSDSDTVELICENFVSYSIVLREGRFKPDDYLNAVSYVSFKLMGYNNQEAYALAFPHRYQALISRGATSKEISSHVAMYNKNKLVNLLHERSMIPIWVLHQDVLERAIKTQLDLMENAKSEMVRMQAANSILMHLRPPERKQVDLSVSTAGSSGMDDLRLAFDQLAMRQREAIDQGVTTQEIAHQGIVAVKHA